MNQKGPPQPAALPPSAADDRRARLSAALRENLKRRKAQGRARKAQATDKDEPPHSSGN